MKNKLHTFLTMVKYEMIRVARNKIVLGFVLMFPIFMALILSSMNYSAGYPVAIFKDGLLDSEIQVLDLITENISSEDIIEVQTEEGGLNLLKSGKVYFFISLDSETEPTAATFYYDESSAIGIKIVNKLEKAKIDYAYESLTTFLSDYGISINESYFELIQFETCTNSSITYNQRILPIEIASFISIVIMFGLAFSMSRDNETGVVRQISYTPVGINRYLFSKMIPYFILAIIQTIILLLMGQWVFHLAYSFNLFYIILVSILFIFANLCLGLLICTVRNQIASAFIAIGTVLLPIFAVALAYIEFFPNVVQALLYLFPTSSYIMLMRYMIFNGVIIPWYLIVFVLQIVIYYLLAYFILKRRTGK